MPKKRFAKTKRQPKFRYLCISSSATVDGVSVNSLVLEVDGRAVHAGETIVGWEGRPRLPWERISRKGEYEGGGEAGRSLKLKLSMDTFGQTR